MSTINLEPLYDKVVIKPAPAETKTKSGIVLPDTAEKEKPQKGEIIAVGRGKYIDGKLIRPQVKIGDNVLYKKYGPDEINIDGEEYLIGSEEDILAIIK